MSLGFREYGAISSSALRESGLSLLIFPEGGTRVRVRTDSALLDRRRQIPYIPSQLPDMNHSPETNMFGIGLPEMIVILAVALIVVGPDKLPELARSLAKGVNELRGVMNQVKESLSEETKVLSSVGDELRQTAGQMKDSLLDEPGGPRRPLSEAELAEKEDDLAERRAEREAGLGMAVRPWERDAAEGRKDAAAPAAEVQPRPEEPPAAGEASAVTEETAVGRNPAPSSPAA